jgi:hypothetical protein
MITTEYVKFQVDGDVYITLDGMEFTADAGEGEWTFTGDDNWQRVVDESGRLGIDPDAFWSVYEPRLDAIMGWDK